MIEKRQYRPRCGVQVDRDALRRRGCAGGANDVWIFQTTGDLSQPAATSVTLSGGARAKNIFWQLAGQVTLGANSHFEGVIPSKTAITLQTGATMNGRALAQTQVVLQQATITQPAP